MKALWLKGENDQILIELSEDMVDIVTTGEGASDEGLAHRIDRNKLEEISETVAAVCTSMRTKALDAMQTLQPDEFSLEFGVKLAGKAGIPLVTEGSAEAAIKVTAKWIKET